MLQASAQPHHGDVVGTVSCEQHYTSENKNVNYCAIYNTFVIFDELNNYLSRQRRGLGSRGRIIRIADCAANSDVTLSLFTVQ